MISTKSLTKRYRVGGHDLLATNNVSLSINRGEFVAIDDCGHYPWVEQPEAFISVISGFTDSLLFWSPDEAPGDEQDQALF